MLGSYRHDQESIPRRLGGRPSDCIIPPSPPIPSPRRSSQPSSRIPKTKTPHSIIFSLCQLLPRANRLYIRLSLMRVPSIPAIIRTLYTLSNATARSFPQQPRGQAIPLIHRATVLKSMPSIPFLSSLFGTFTPTSDKMSYPDQRSNDEWRAVLNKGTDPNAPSP